MFGERGMGRGQEHGTSTRLAIGRPRRQTGLHNGVFDLSNAHAGTGGERERAAAPTANQAEAADQR